VVAISRFSENDFAFERGSPDIRIGHDVAPELKFHADPCEFVGNCLSPESGGSERCPQALSSEQRLKKWEAGQGLPVCFLGLF
jgi:hypothetical protein